MRQCYWVPIGSIEAVAFSSLLSMQAGKSFKVSQQEQQTLAELKSWLYSAGARYDSLQVQYLKQGYRGVVSTQPIKKHQAIVFVPKSRLITLEIAREDPISRELLCKQVELMSPKHTYLAVFLLQELLKGQQSPWRLYLELLPQDHSNFPINFSNPELSQLIGSPFLIQIHEKVYDLKRDYDRVYLASEEFRKYKFRDFCWARTVVGSRIFGLHIDGSKTDILAPFADMLNHRLPKQTTWNYIDDQQGFLIESLQHIDSGVEVFDSYGKKCNSRYLLNYGFVVDLNPENQVCLKVELDGPLRMRKMEMLQRSQGSKILKISAHLTSTGFYEAMGFLRFKQVSDPAQLAVLQKISGIKVTGTPYLPTKTPPITIEIECAIWQTLQSLCQSALQEYNTTKEQDQDMLSQGGLSANLRNIVVLRLGQKRVLLKLIEYARELIPVLRQGFAKSYEHLQANPEKDWSKYLGKILKLMPGNKEKKWAEHEQPESELEENEDAEEELRNN